MSYDYAMSRVHDALEQSEGNHLKAQRLLLKWLEKDHTLLVGLAGPHVQSIVAYAVTQASGRPGAKPLPKHVDLDDDVPPPGKASQKHVDAIRKLASASKGKGKAEK